MKTFMSVAIAAFVIIIANTSVIAENFSDLDNSYWAYNQINTLSNQNIITGYNDNTFKPDASVTRAEFATMIIKALGKQNQSIAKQYMFKDLSPQFWAYDNIQRAYNLGLITGYPDGTFRPNDLITKTQSLVIISNAIKSGNISEYEAKNLLNRYTGASNVPSWAVIPVAKTIKDNIIVNYPDPNNLYPYKNTTRAEVASMLFNVMKNQKLLTNNNQQQNDINNQQYSDQYYSSQNNSSDLINNQQYSSQNNQQYSDQYYSNQNNQYYSEQSNQYTSDYPPLEAIINESYNGATSSVVLKGNVATITENSVIPTQLETSLNSEVSQVGDTILLRLPKDLRSREGILLIPQNSKIYGKVESVIPKKYANRNASMALHFDTLEMPNGQKYRLNASVATETGDLTAGSTASKVGKGALKTLGGAGIGAALGTALGAITGKTGKGAIYGSAFGGGLGVISSILAKGGEINVPSNEPLFIKLDSPLTIDTRYYNK